MLCSRHGEHALDDIAKAKQRAADKAIQIRADVDARMARLHFLRNRVAHHKPIHRRALADDAKSILELAGWMCTDTLNWMVGVSRIPEVLDSRPA